MSMGKTYFMMVGGGGRSSRALKKKKQVLVSFPHSATLVKERQVRQNNGDWLWLLTNLQLQLKTAESVIYSEGTYWPFACLDWVTFHNIDFNRGAQSQGGGRVWGKYKGSISNKGVVERGSQTKGSRGGGVWPKAEKKSDLPFWWWNWPLPQQKWLVAWLQMVLLEFKICPSCCSYFLRATLEGEKPFWTPHHRPNSPSESMPKKSQ